jgi:hypothetical protein
MNATTRELTQDLSPHTSANAEGWAKLKVAVEVPLPGRSAACSL